MQKLTDYKFVFDRGSKFVFEGFIAFYVQEEFPEVFAWGVIASKKVGGAVKRNRCKRLLRVVCRNFDSSGVRGKLILIARRTLLDLPYEKIEREASICFKKIQNIRQKSIQ